MAGVDEVERVDEVWNTKWHREKSVWKQPRSRESPAEAGDHEIMMIPILLDSQFYSQ